MDLASHFVVPANTIRMIFQSNAALEPAGKLTKTLDQGLGAINFGHPRLDVPQPGEIRLAGLIAQGRLRIFQFPK